MASAPPEVGRLRARRLLAGGLAVVVLLGAALAAYRHFGWHRATLSATRLVVDLSAPDAVIASSSLSRLPRDLLKVPLLRDVLTEDLAFYYEQHEDRLGLAGALKRIAWEHQVGWGDRMLALALDEPAELAFWRDGNGALRHSALVMRRGALAALLQDAAAIALKDRQLVRLKDAAGHRPDFPVYALRLSPRRTLIVAVRGERVAVLSDPGMLLDREGRFVPAARDALAAWLAQDGVLSARLALERGTATHAIALSSATFTLGYDALLPGVQAARFDFEGEQWATRLRLRPAALPKAGLVDPGLWRSAPANAAACTLLPVDAQFPKNVLATAKAAPDGLRTAAASAIDGAALACWYPQSTLYAPVFVARVAGPVAADDAAFAALAGWALRKPVFRKSQLEDASMARTPAPLSRSAAAGATEPRRRWRAAGAEPAHGRDHVAALLAAPTLAAAGGLGVFSPDAAMVELTLDTIARKYPSVGDQLPAHGVTLAMVSPRMLADMLQREALAAVPKAGEPVLAGALATHLVPRLRALARHPPYRLVITETAARGEGWQRASWEAMP